MKSYGSKEAVGLLREAINISAQGEMWHHKHMLWAQFHGLQGHKRLNRYESEHDRKHSIKLQNYCIDMFGEIVEPEWGYTVAEPGDIREYLEGYLDWENSVYTRLAEINSELIQMGFPYEAKLVREGLPMKEIGKVRCMLEEYGLSGWDMTYILIKDKELHEKMKKKEKRH